MTADLTKSELARRERAVLHFEADYLAVIAAKGASQWFSLTSK
jgi:hypothetical protein